jgi:DNA-binding transcriptional regulator YiaG
MTKTDLQATRAAWGLSQPQMAKEMRVPTSTLRNWEQGRRPVPEWVGRMVELIQKNDKGEGK